MATERLKLDDSRLSKTHWMKSDGLSAPYCIECDAKNCPVLVCVIFWGKAVKSRPLWPLDASGVDNNSNIDIKYNHTLTIMYVVHINIIHRICFTHFDMEVPLSEYGLTRIYSPLLVEALRIRTYCLWVLLYSKDWICSVFPDIMFMPFALRTGLAMILQLRDSGVVVYVLHCGQSSVVQISDRDHMA